MAEVQQLFDTTSDPTAKQRFLSRSTNVARCQSCGYEGLLNLPIVYHDAEKELLLTFFPPEAGLSINEQEKQLGPLINQVVNALPVDKRKGYLFQPQTMLTFQTMIDRILEADGITKEMLEAQQKRVNLIQRLITNPNPEERKEIMRQEDELVDGSFFTILSTIIESAMMQGDEKSAQMLGAIQSELLQETKFGRELWAQNQEAQKAIKALQEASKEGLTREKLIEILGSITSDSALTTVVSMTRSGLDYQFFQSLTEMLEKSPEAEKKKLTDLRDKLLKITREYDLELKRRMEESEKLLNAILNDSDIENAVKKHLQEMDEFFTQAIRAEFDKANQAGDLARIEKIQKVTAIIEKESAPPPEIELIQKLMDAKDETEQTKILDENSAMVTDEFVQALNSIVSEGKSRSQSPEMMQSLESIYKLVLRYSMQKKLKE
jgi:hypothetical protein